MDYTALHPRRTVRDHRYEDLKSYMDLFWSYYSVLYFLLFYLHTPDDGQLGWNVVCVSYNKVADLLYLMQLFIVH
jgi:hypothetical protein